MVGHLLPRARGGAYVGELVDAGVEVFKIHVQVGAFRLDDPLLDDVWGGWSRAARRSWCTRVRVRCPTRSPARRPLERVLHRWPRLAMVVAHLGAPEYVEFLELAERFERVHLDTTMAFTDFFERVGAVPECAAAAARRPG